MPNSNYQAGRRFEYERMAAWRSKGYEVLRTAGSHGAYDLIAFRKDRLPEFIQCKVVSTPSAMKRLLKSFKPDDFCSGYYHQVLEVKVKGSIQVYSKTL